MWKNLGNYFKPVILLQWLPKILVIAMLYKFSIELAYVNSINFKTNLNVL